MGLLLLGQNVYPDHGGKQPAPKAQDIAALHAVEAGQGSEVQPVHAESGGEGSHGGKAGGQILRLPLHLGKQGDAYCHQGPNSSGPNEEVHSPLPQFMFPNGHACSPPSA